MDETASTKNRRLTPLTLAKNEATWPTTIDAYFFNAFRSKRLNVAFECKELDGNLVIGVTVLTRMAEMAASNIDHTALHGDYHLAKRDLLRRAVASGSLRLSEIRKQLPPPHISLAELELLIFSAEALGVEVIRDIEDD